MSRRADLTAALAALAPTIPAFEASAVIDRALDSPGLRAARASEAAWLALVAYVRHSFTDYDALLDEGYDVDSARFFVIETMETILRGWGVRRPITGREGAVDPAGLAP